MTVYRSIQLVLIAAALILCASCGGGGSGESTDNPGANDGEPSIPPTPVVVADAPPPPAIGSYWITTGVGPNGHFTVKAIVIKNAIYRGKEVFVVELTDDLSADILPEGAGIQTLYVDEATYNRVAEFYEFDTPAIRFMPHLGQLAYPLQLGANWRSTFDVIEGDGGRNSAWRAYEVVDSQELQVAGETVTALRIYLKSASEGFDNMEVLWFAPGIGVVQYQSDTLEWALDAYKLEPRDVEGDVLTYCADWTRLDLPPLLYDNNVWGRGPLEDYEQCLVSRETASGKQFGWHWDWPQLPQGAGDIRHQVKAYPGILYGHKPWHHASTTPGMPIRIADISEMSVSYSVDLDASGAYNLAFDIFLSSTNPPTPASATTEIMIWPHRSLAGDGDEMMYAQPAEYLVGHVAIGGREYELYRRANFDPYFADESRPADYDSLFDIIQFVGLESCHADDLDLTLFLGHLVDEGYIERSDYVAVIEFGTEIIHGSGELWVEEYQVTVE